jgi:putative Holliday junction resolvase
MMTRIVALDPGARRIGVAVSDPLRITAQPYGTLDATAHDLDQQLGDLVRDLAAELIIVGHPVGLNGTEGPAAREARAFAQRVGEATGLPVKLHDERLTTVTAERVLLEAGLRRERRRAARDRVAAAVLLQSYLDGTA